MGPFNSQNCEQEFLDEGQYQKNGILRYEKIFGKTFVSTGGETTTKEFVDSLGLKAGMKVLDIGSGTGGSAFYMARHHGVHVLGLDLSDNMLAIANDHKAEMDPAVRDLVEFRHQDALEADLVEGSFNVVYSRDAIMHIADKPRLYQNIHKWLKPGGKLLVSEYIHGKKHPAHSQEYIEYIANRGYQLLTPEGYKNVLEGAGFTNVEACDITPMFVEVLRGEMERFKPTKDAFVKEFSQKDYDELVEGWEVKVDRCSQGEQGWGLFKASK